MKKKINSQNAELFSYILPLHDPKLVQNAAHISILDIHCDV